MAANSIINTISSFASLTGPVLGGILYSAYGLEPGLRISMVCGINLFLSAMFIVALPYLVTEVLNLEVSQANRLYGFAQGALAAGGIFGGICAFSGSVSLAISRLSFCLGSVFPQYQGGSK